MGWRTTTWAQAKWGDKVEAFATNKAELWGQSCEVTYAAVANGDLTNDGDETFGRHLKNALPARAA